VHARAAPTRRLPSGRQDFARSWTNLTANSEGAVTSFWDFDWGAALERGASGGGFPDETIFATAYGAGRGALSGPCTLPGRRARGPPASAFVPLGFRWQFTWQEWLLHGALPSNGHRPRAPAGARGGAAQRARPP